MKAKKPNILIFFQNHKIYIYGALVVFLFLLTFLSVQLFQNNFANKISQSKIQQVILEKEKGLINFENEIKRRLEKQGGQFYFTKEDLLHSKNTNLNYFVY